jgi:MFS family permease
MTDLQRASAPDELDPVTRRKAIVAGSLGNFIEFYDWTIYGLLAAVFSAQMFPGSDPSVTLLASLGTFAIGFLARPVGAILLSPLGDRYGRRFLFSLTVLGIGAGSLVIAVLPTYQTIGIAAPLLILVARIVQGLAAGAEFQTGVAYLIEHSPSHRRGFIGSFQITSIVLGTLAASLVSQATSAVMTPEAFAAWGWRVPFAVGALLAVYGFVLRAKATETPVFEQVRLDRELNRAPEAGLAQGLRQHWLACVRVASINMATLPYYLWTVFLPTYAHLTTGIPLAEAFVANAVALAVFAAVLPLAGGLSDRVGRKPMLLVGGVGFILGTYPLLAAVREGGFVTLLLVSLAGCLLLACIDSVMAATFSELVPAHIRVTGIGIPYSIAGALFGGTAPLISAAFISAGTPDLISVYVIAVMVVAVSVWLFMPETRKRTVDASTVRPTEPEPVE